MTDTLPRRFTTVTAPNMLTAIGEVLRKAFRRPPPVELFERLIVRLDRR
jgi:hypothetical protein